MNTPALVLRQFSHHPWYPLALALLVALLGVGVTAAPRYASALDDAQLSHRLDSLSAMRGDVAGAWTASASHASVDGLDDPWEPFREAAEQLRTGQPQPLATMLQPAQFLATPAAVAVYTPDPATGYYQVSFQPFIDPDLLDHVEIVDGTPPEPAALIPGAWRIEVSVLESVAAKMDWQVGDVLPSDGYVISSVHRVLDPTDPRWQHIELGNSFAELVDPNRGMSLRAGLFLSPRSTGNFGEGEATALRLQMWFGTDLADASGVGVADLRSQLTGLLTRSWPMPVLGADGSLTSTEVSLVSELGAALDTVLAQQRTTNSVLLVLATGPGAMVVVLMLLVVRLLGHRRAATTALAHARGASPEQLRGMALAEGLALGVPAALAGCWIGLTLVPGPPSPLWWPVITALAVGVLPAIGLALAASGTRPGGRATDLGARSGRWRLVLELLLVGVAAVAVWRLLSPTPAAVDQGGSIDPLAAVAPVVLTAALGVATLRLYPLPLHALHRLLARGRGLVGQLGPARALRSPAGGLVPLFAVLTGTSVAMLALVLHATVTHGIQAAAADRVGADINLSGPVVTDDLAEAIRAVDGVDQVARLHDTNERRRLQTGDGDVAVSVWLAESTLGQVYDGIGTRQVPDLDGGPSPTVVVGGDVPAVDSDVSLAGVGSVAVASRWDSLPGAPRAGSWILFGTDAWTSLGGDLSRSTLALVSIDGSADARAVAADIRLLVGSGLVEVIDDQLDDARGNPAIAALGTLLGGIALVTVLLMLAAIVVAQTMGGTERARTAGILRVLGAPRGAARALAAWELLPVVASALLVGSVLGVGTAALLVQALDFTSLTTGVRAPAIHLDPVLLTGGLAGVLFTTGIAVAASAWLSGRTDLSRLTREGP